MEHLAEEYASIQENLNSLKKKSDKQEQTKVSESIFNNIKKFQHEEYQYLNLLENILENGCMGSW